MQDDAIRATGSGSGNAVTSALSRLSEYPKRLRAYLHDVRVEMRQVNWPSRLDVWSTTIVVTVTVAFFGVYFWLTDLALTRLYRVVNHYFQKF